MSRMRRMIRGLTAALAVGSLAATLLAVPALLGPVRTGDAAPQVQAVRIRTVDVDRFPEVTITVSIPGGEVEAGDVRVTENGRPVSPVTVRPLVEAGTDVDVVLVVDVSGSMEGEPLGSAIAAALRFVTTLPPEGIRVGIVTFSDRPAVVQPLTDEHARALEALGELKADGETALYDAVVRAAELFGGETQANMVVLSDGGDTVSEATLKEAVAAARAARVTVYTVGLTSGEADIDALRTLAQRTGGRYAPAATADLSAVYQDLATEIGGQYVVTYRSPYRAGGEVSVAVTGPAGSDSALVLLPKVEPPRPSPTGSPEPARPLLRGETGLQVVLGLIFLAAFVLLVMILGARARARRDRELVRRMAAGPEAQPGPERERILAGWIPEPVVLGAERIAAVGGFGARIAAGLERGGIPLRAGEFVAGMGLAGMVGVALGAGVLRSPVFAVALGTVAAGVPVVLLRRSVKRRSKHLHGQLADILMILASSLRAGHSFFQALDMVAKEIGEPGATEFGRVVAEIRLGRQVDEALNAMAERIGSDDFKWAVLGVNVQREVGGNLAEVLDTVAETVREREQIRRQIDVLSAEGRLSIGILSALPFLVALYIAKVNPGYLNLLFATRVGLVMTATAGSLMAVGIAWMRKIVSIDV